MDILDERIRDIILSSEIEENTVKLTCGDLGKDYKPVNDVLVRCGGKWNTKFNVHTFERGTEFLRTALGTLILPPKNPLAFFPTPKALAQQAVDFAAPFGKVLEPSAGTGAFLKVLRDEYEFTNEDLTVIEYDPFNCIALREEGFEPIMMDFMDWNKDYSIQYDTVIMNPPFSVKGDPIAYISHFLHAHDMWNGNGNFIAIVPPAKIKAHSAEYDKNPKIRRFQEIVRIFGHVHENDKNAFRESGTNIDTVIILLCAG